MTKPIRILQINGKLDRGGAEAMIMNLYRAIDRNVVQFDFVVHASDSGAFDAEVRNLGGNLYCVPRYTGKNHYAYIRWWESFFDEHPEYHVVHSHIRSTASIIFPIAKKHNCITIAHSHSTSSGKGISAVVKNILQYRIRYEADYMFGCSQIAGEWLFGKKACASPQYFNLRNAIDASAYKYDKELAVQMRKDLGYTDSDIVVGHVGRFTAPKNHAFLLDIFNELQKKEPRFRLLLVGDGELRKEIEDKISSLGLTDKVTCTGLRADVNRLLMAMDVFLFPSKWEGLPVSVVEAQATGLRCVISSTITSEVCLSSLVMQIPLTESKQVWCEKILEICNLAKTEARRDMQKCIAKAGYDVSATAKWLSDFYWNCYSEEF